MIWDLQGLCEALLVFKGREPFGNTEPLRVPDPPKLAERGAVFHVLGDLGHAGVQQGIDCLKGKEEKLAPLTPCMSQMLQNVENGDPFSSFG